jgi:hypothetical protein
MKYTGTIKDEQGKSHTLNLDLLPVTTTEPAPQPEPTPEPQPEPTTSTIPLSWDATQFSKNTAVSPITVSGTLENKTITSHAEPAAIVMRGGSALKNVRVGGNVREGVRISSGDVTIDGCWLEAKGSGDDHADVIQGYAGPDGATFSLTVRNSLIRAYNQAATAGLFIADRLRGKVTLDNVVFWGGPFGLALYSDVNTIDVYAKDVFFVGPFGWRPIDFRNAGGTVVIKQWDNVRNATIVDGKLVPGTVIPRP